VQEIGLGSPRSRYAALERRLSAAAQRRERVVDLRLVFGDGAMPKAVRILWERPARAPTRLGGRPG
jgi:hypothetical protein